VYLGSRKVLVVDLVAGLEWDMVLGLRMGLGLETDLDLETGLVMIPNRELDVQMGAAMVVEGVPMKKNKEITKSLCGL
jgi:hypothetical protein